MSKQRARHNSMAYSNGNGNGGVKVPPATWIMLGLTLFLHVAHFGYTSGVVTTRVVYIEKTQDEHKARLETVSILNAKLVGVEEKLTAINSTLIRLERQLGKSGQ